MNFNFWTMLYLSQASSQTFIIRKNKLILVKKKAPKTNRTEKNKNTINSGKLCEGCDFQECAMQGVSHLHGRNRTQ